MSSPLIQAPNVTALAARGLQTWLTDHHDLRLPVGNHKPHPRPQHREFIRLFDSGGAARRAVVIGPTTLTVESYAAEWGRAWDLASLADAWVHGLQDDDGVLCPGLLVYRVEAFARPGQLPDPQDGPRYTATYSLDVRGIRQ